MKISIRYKFSVFLTLLLSFLIIIITITVLEAIDRSQTKDLETNMLKSLSISEKYISQMYGMSDSIMTEKSYLQTFSKEICNSIGSIIEMDISLFDEAGSPIFYDGKVPQNVYNNLVLNKDTRNSYVFFNKKIYFKGIIVDQQKDLAVIILSKSINNEINFFNSIRNKIIISSSIVFIISLLLCIFYFKGHAGRILKLKESTLSIVDGKYFIDTIPCNDEIGELSKDIQFMGKEISRNIEEITREKQNLQLALNKVRKMESEHRQFIGNVTHEFKTPLTSIKAYIDLLKTYQDDPVFLNEAITNISNENNRLCEMVERVLKLQAIEKYDFEFNIEKVSLKHSISEICQRLSGKAEKYRVEVVCDVEDLIVQADREAVHHIFLNLLDNSIKYNKQKGKVHIYSKEMYRDAEIIIEDTGIGIPREDSEKIFEPFYTSSKDRCSETSGSGLGLTIVKEFLEKQNGSIALLKSSEEGSIFRITLPLYRE